jgi:hypothetical protein
MSNCKRIKAIVSEYIDGELTRDQQRSIEAHLAECKTCDEVIAHVKLLRRNLHELKKIETSPDFETILRTRIRIESGVSRQRLYELFWTGPVRWPLYGMATALIVIASIMVFDQVKKNNKPARPNAYVNDQWFGGKDQNQSSIPVMQQTDNVIYVLDTMTPEDALRSQQGGSSKIDTTGHVHRDTLDSPKAPIYQVTQRTY